MLQVPGQRFRSRCGNRTRRLEILYDRRAGTPDLNECGRDPALGAFRRTCLVEPHRRSRAQCHLRHDRQQLQRARNENKRCIHGARHARWRDSLGETDDRGRYVEQRLQDAG